MDETDLGAELGGGVVEEGCRIGEHVGELAEELEAHEAEQEYGIKLIAWDQLPAQADAIVAAVSHSQYLAMPLGDILSKLKLGGVFIDVKSAHSAAALTSAGLHVWKL